MRTAAIVTVGCVLQIAGCAIQSPINRSFPLTLNEAHSAWNDMAAHSAPLTRPVIVLSGIFDSGHGADHVARRLRAIATSDDQIISVSFTGAPTFDECARRVLHTIEARFPCNDPQQTVEVDIVACSMGGLVARYAASDWFTRRFADEKRLRIARLFTINTPHRGAKLAPAAALLDHRIDCMQPGSPFLIALDAEHVDYPIIPYARLDDGVVGEENSAPPGCNAWWVPNELFNSAHMSAKDDERILADIARRLRGEQPFTTEPAAELPPKHLLVRSFEWKHG